MRSNTYVKVAGELKFRTYDTFVDMLFKQDTKEMMLLHAALGICGEAGELGDAIKKSVIYGKPLDTANVIEELGDLRFYMEALAGILELRENSIIQHNVDKLSKRYKELKYSNEAAIAREDKAE